VKIIDISWPITQHMTQYKDRDEVKIEQVKVFEKDSVRSSTIKLGSHTGTHIDSPAHLLQDGGSIEEIDLTKLMGRCRVLNLTSVEEAITENDLAPCAISADEIILLKTSNSALPNEGPFNKNFVYLEKSGAAYLARCNIKAVGIDYLGIERNQPDHETHITLLKNGISIIEGLRLQNVEEGEYKLKCLPLSIRGVEAAPARAVLIEIE
jgi:arylformamidase